MQNKSIVSVQEYFNKGQFVIPYYQRGYKWSLMGMNGKTYLEQLLEDLVKAFKSSNKDFHLQGVTVKENEVARIELVDGQQRTTSLFLILLFLQKRLSLDIGIKGFKPEKLDYQVRDEVNKWLKNAFEGEQEQFGDSATNQELAAFNAAWKSITDHLNASFENDKDEEGVKDFTNFVLNKVKLIYVVLNTEPTRVFSMLNKDKAIMSQTDLVKAELLSEASRQAFADLHTSDETDNEWQINHLRSHFAREWESWRQWWEKKEHYEFYGKALSKGSKEPELSRLLLFYWQTRIPLEEGGKSADDVSAKRLFVQFEDFICDKDSEEGNAHLEAVEVFEGLRKCQKVLEEWYDDPEIYNWLGLLLWTNQNSRKVVVSLFECYLTGSFADFKEALKRKAKIALLSDEGEDLSERIVATRQKLDSEYVYGAYDMLASMQLLRMNIEELGGRKFEFANYNGQNSLEHVWPKSKVVTRQGKVYENEDSTEAIEAQDKNTAEFLDFTDAPQDISEHCIGNLVLLERTKNSSVGTKLLKEKRAILMRKFSEGAVLPHTLQVFSKAFPPTKENKNNSKDTWGKEDIIACKKHFFTSFSEAYKTIGGQK